MLTKNQEKLIKSLQTKKGRKEHGLCLVEGKKVIELAGDYIEYTFGPKDSKQFNKLVTTETPQDMAAVAKIPQWSDENIKSNNIIVLLDGVQDPGNVGSILRLCLGFGASLILSDSANVASPKVIRSSVGAMFKVPWLQIKSKDIMDYVESLGRKVYRLEKKSGSVSFDKVKVKSPLVLVAGSEGNGIQIKIKGQQVYIEHNNKLESLNVGQALAIALYLLK